MKIISLSGNDAGPACAIADAIKKYYYNNNCQTNIFDHLEISLKSINNIIELNDIENLINNNFSIFENKDSKNTVCFNNLEKMVSHHDLKLNFNQDDFNNQIIEKYNRRFYRFLNSIQNENKIFFIRYGFENIEVIKKFYENIKKINNKLCFYFINVNFDENNIIIQYNLENYFYFNFNDFCENNYMDQDLYFKTLNFNWEYIFKSINKLL